MTVTLRLMPLPSSRAAAQQPDREGTWSFHETPRKGDTIRLGLDWPDDFVGRAYLVTDVELPLPLNGGPGRPIVEATRLS